MMNPNERAERISATLQRASQATRLLEECGSILSTDTEELKLIHQNVQSITSTLQGAVARLSQVHQGVKPTDLTATFPPLPRIGFPFFTQLPDELVRSILMKLEQPADLLRASRTCKRFRMLCQDYLVWSHMYRRYFADDISHSALDELRAKFRKRWPVERNWRRGVCRLYTHRHPYPSRSLHFDGVHFVAGDERGAVSLCEATSDQCMKRSWKVHSAAVTTVYFDPLNMNVISGDMSGNLYVWEVMNGVSKRFLKSAHADCLTSLQFDNEIIVCYMSLLLDNNYMKTHSICVGFSISGQDSKGVVSQ